MNVKISQFENIFQSENGNTILLNEFLNEVRFGKYKDIVEPIRLMSSKEDRTQAKKKLPYVTISGEFPIRNSKSLKQHSGFIAIDFDNLNQNLMEVKQQLVNDSFTYAMFTSVSGTGICVLVKIDPAKHKEAFDGLYVYYVNTYKFIPDVACKDQTRPRFVSYDPELFQNEKSQTFKKYLPKKQPVYSNQVVSQSDISDLISQIQARGVNITEPYIQWVNIAFALVDECGEQGRQYFHIISAQSPKYNEKESEDFYTYCMNRDPNHTHNKVTIGSLFHFAKVAGISAISKRTREITEIAIQAKKQGRDATSVERILTEIMSPGSVASDEDKELIKKVLESNITESSGEQNIFDKLQLYIHSNYKFKFNEILLRLEENGEDATERSLNSIFVDAKKYVDIKLSKNDYMTFMNSNAITEYNPLKDFIESRASLEVPTGNIKKLAETITTDTGFAEDNFFPQYVQYFLEKWLVGMIASIYGGFSPLLLVLTGETQNTGKTEWFRRLLPDELRKDYYAESKLDDGKDADIRMCQKLLIMDDEMSGKTKLEIKHLKELTSKQGYSIRVPYGIKPMTMRRLAVLCGTSNDPALLSDPTGNRRIIPIHITGVMNFDLYNSINKTDLLMEVYHLWKSGFKYNLTMEDIKKLNENTIEFEQVRPERESIVQFFENPDEDDSHNVILLTATQIKDYIEEKSNQKYYPNKIGVELNALKFRNKRHKVCKITELKYRVRYREQKEHTESMIQEDISF